jgi:hypothetical protein
MGSNWDCRVSWAGLRDTAAKNAKYSLMYCKGEKIFEYMQKNHLL